MTTLREAAQDVVDALIKNPTRVSKEVHIASVVLREVLAQPEPEPVAWLYVVGKFRHVHPNQIDNYYSLDGGETSIKGIPLYTAPPQREWQGLTDDEIEQIKKETYEQFHFAVMTNGSAVRNINDVWRNLEAKLKEKNAC